MGQSLYLETKKGESTRLQEKPANKESSLLTFVPASVSFSVSF